jgi:hypothetical protein
MTLAAFLEQARSIADISFTETIQTINDHYLYQATEFSTGLAEFKLVNVAGTNEGSCRILAFASLHQLSEAQTLNLFGDYYRQDVLKNPEANDHQNIRNFMRDGWAGVDFQGVALLPKMFEGQG